MSTPLLAGTVRPPPAAGVRAEDRGRPAAPSWFRETPASAAVAEVVVARWVGVGGWDRTLRVLPDGCADLIWAGDRLIVVGAHPGAQRFPVPAELHNVGLRLRPGAGRAVLGVPLGELPPGAVPAVDLWGPAAARLEDDLHHARDVDGRHDVLERHVASCLSSRTVDPAVVTAARLLGRSGTSVARAAGEVGLSPRELRRRFVADVGYGPKTLHRILRFQAAVRTMTSGEVALADLAARHGYADQSHLGRETRRLSGSSPARLVALRSRIAG